MRHTGIASVNDASAVKPDGSLLHLTSRHPHAVAGAFIQGTGCAYSPDAFYYADSFFFSSILVYGSLEGAEGWP